MEEDDDDDDDDDDDCHTARRINVYSHISVLFFAGTGLLKSQFPEQNVLPDVQSSQRSE